MAKDTAYKLFFKEKPKFLGSFPAPDKINFRGGAEVAFIGRSNVGKSSLINAITKCPGLAKTSSTPGRTRMINMFLMHETFTLVDLPGYGYAKASKKDIETWNRNTRNYLLGRIELQRVFLLIDARHGIKSTDIESMKVFDEAGVNYQIILTKTDKISKKELEKVLADTEKKALKHPALHPTILWSSSEKGDNLDEIKKVIHEIFKAQ